MCYMYETEANLHQYLTIFSDIGKDEILQECFTMEKEQYYF